MEIDEKGGRILAQKAKVGHVAGIPLATVLRVNRERTIPIERYEEDGCFDRFKYLQGIADENNVPLAGVIDTADLLGADEDFDGLVTTVEDHGPELRAAYS